MSKTLKNLTINRVALVPAGSNPLADVVLIKSKPEVSPQPKEPVFMKKNIDISKLSPEEQATMATLLQKSATDVADPAPAAAAAEEIIKALPPEAQAILKSAQEQAAQAIAKAEEATATALFEKHAREENEFVAQVSPVIKHFPGKTDETARMLHRVKKAVLPADYTALESMLKAGNAALDSATAERGTTQGGSDSSPDLNELDTMAKALQKEKNLTYSEAYALVLEQNPEKVAQIRKAKKARRQQDEDNN